MKQDSSFIGFAGRIIVAHFTTYFTIGLIFALTGLNVMVYYENNPTPLVNELFRPTSSVWVMAGSLFQLVRGALFAIALYPLRKVILEEIWGWLTLWGIFLVFAILAPSSAAPGSIEGMIYTTLPLSFHLFCLPEIILQTLLFSVLVIVWEQHKTKKLSIPLVGGFSLILLMVALGVVQTFFLS